MKIKPTTLKAANEFVGKHHRHSKPVARNGGRFAIGLWLDELVGVVVIGNPVARLMMDGVTAEVLRCCVSKAAPKNSCSMLYSAAWRAWRAMGGMRMITYTLKEESGSSLKGSGWKVVAETQPRKTGWSRKSRERINDPIYNKPKFRWEVKNDL